MKSSIEEKIQVLEKKIEDLEKQLAEISRVQYFEGFYHKTMKFK